MKDILRKCESLEYHQLKPRAMDGEWYLETTLFANHHNPEVGELFALPLECLLRNLLLSTGAIDFCMASKAILETFSKNYEIFNLPYLFASSETYHLCFYPGGACAGHVYSGCQHGASDDGRAGQITKNQIWFYTVEKPSDTVSVWQAFFCGSKPAVRRL